MDIHNKNGNRNWIIPLLIFLCSFFLILGLTAPGLQINDEWITVNQLHQLIQGHQVLTTEGKYGTALGENLGYFEARHNILGYSLFIPILSYLPEHFIIVTGDLFRLWIILFWILIPIVISLLFQLYYSKKSKTLLIPPYFIGILASGFLLIVNILWYQPFPSQFDTAPIESAAVVLMENGIFALFCTALFCIGHLIYYNNKKALWFTIAMICCSSYAFWATNAKDHMLTAFVLCCVIFTFFNFIRTDSWKNAALSFGFCGLLLWIRPEIGFGVTILITGQYLYIHIKQRRLFKLPPKQIICLLLIPMFFLVGAIPFFTNNYILTKNPFYPPYLEYESGLTSKTTQEITNIDLNDTLPSDYASAYQNQNRSLNYVQLLTKYFTPTSTDFFKDLWRICFFPPNGSLGLIIVSPFIIIGLISIFMLLITRTHIECTDRQAIILCCLISVSIFFAYIRNLPSQPISDGIGPDMRYYSPLYLPMGMIALISMKYWNHNPVSSTMWVKTLLILLIGAPLLIIGLLLLQPWGGGIYAFNYFFSLINIGLLILLLFQMLLMKAKIWFTPALEYNIIGMLLISFTWQIMLIFLYSIAKFDGYTFWIPLTEHLFTQFIIPVG